MGVETRSGTRKRVPRGHRKRTLCGTLRRGRPSSNAVGALKSAAAVDWVWEVRALKILLSGLTA